MPDDELNLDPEALAAHSPLPRIDLGAIDPAEEAEAIKALLRVVFEGSPAMSHLPDYGLRTEAIRTILSEIAGQNVRVPPKAAILRAWEDWAIWVCARTRDAAEAMRRYNVDEGRLVRVARRFAPSDEPVDLTEFEG